MRKAIDEPEFVFHPKYKELEITNVCFADDMFIVCGANETTIVSYSLKMFGELSGLEPNLEKSILYVTGLEEDKALYLGKVKAWGNRHLSFAGRLLLISTIIFGKENYWCQFLYLPSAMIQKIDEIVRRFLWKCEAQGRFLPKVSWRKVTEPREVGGLRVNNLKEWNMACMAHTFGIFVIKRSRCG
ncbi:hypothetical protein LIER_31090 [Lithospermum erythrorhizon]|uniref:Reverse transcriptase n=1 Tax=Lithospermum erythrorhizon TaxID=34254 RepID=A0AAV3RQV5_LITER